MHRQKIKVIPSFNDFSVADADGACASKFDFPIRCLDPQSITLMRATYDAPRDELLAFRNRIDDLHIDVRKSAEKLPMKLFERLHAAHFLPLLIHQSMHDRVWGGEPIDRFGILFVPNFIEPFVQ